MIVNMIECGGLTPPMLVAVLRLEWFALVQEAASRPLDSVEDTLCPEARFVFNRPAILRKIVSRPGNKNKSCPYFF